MVSNRQLNNRKSGPQEDAVYERLFVGVVTVAVAVATTVAVAGGGVVAVATTVATVAGIATVAVGVAATVREVLDARRTSDRRQQRTGAAALRLVTWLLPSEARQDYAEEWRRWLSDLREAKEPWYRRLIELLTILLIAAPHLAVILRLGRRRAVD